MDGFLVNSTLFILEKGVWASIILFVINLAALCKGSIFFLLCKKLSQTQGVLPIQVNPKNHSAVINKMLLHLCRLLHS